MAITRTPSVDDGPPRWIMSIDIPLDTSPPWEEIRTHLLCWLRDEVPPEQVPVPCRPVRTARFTLTCPRDAARDDEEEAAAVADGWIADLQAVYPQVCADARRLAPLLRE
jgi:hypothetical protein